MYQQKKGRTLRHVPSQYYLRNLRIRARIRILHAAAQLKQDLIQGVRRLGPDHSGQLLVGLGAQGGTGGGVGLAALGIEQGDGTPVVTSAAGTRLDSSNLYRWWRKNGPALFGIDCSLHELRHTFLTMLGNSGASAAALKSIAGWSSLAMADVYVHRDEDADADAVRMLESRLSAR